MAQETQMESEKEYRLKFEFFGKRMQTSVMATSKADAMKQVAARLNFNEVERVDDEPLDSIFSHLLDKLRVGKKR